MDENSNLERFRVIIPGQNTRGKIVKVMARLNA